MLLGAAALLPFGAKVVSAAPPAETITPALVEAARKEGKVSYYTAMDLSVAEPMAKAFEAKFPGIKVAVERTGAERLFNRLAQETAMSGFDAVLGGIREPDGKYSRLEAHGVYWTASENDKSTAPFYNFGKGSSALYRQAAGEKQRAISVRCVKDY
jgi:hypothetical protein